MKQLLLYFLFFVGSAIILVQCAKLFPTIDKLPKQQSQSRARIDSSGYNKQSSTTLVIANTPAFKFSFKKKIIAPLFYKSGFIYNMMSYFNSHLLFYDPAIGLNYYDLVRKYKRGSHEDKR